MDILYKRFNPLRTVFYALFLGFALLLSGPAATEGLFVVEDIRVDVTADNAIAAREQAFAKAQGDAFLVLAGRMLSESELASYALPPGQVISSLIKDYEVTEEKLSAVRYIGTYTFRFKDRDVRRFFSGSGVQYTDVASKPVLVLPFYETGGQLTLWSPYNSWMQAWGRTRTMSGLVPAVLPMGDLADIQDIGNEEALNYDRGGLESMLSRYGAGEAAIVIAAPDAALAAAAGDDVPASGRLTVRIYRTDRSGPEFVRQVEVESDGSLSRSRLLEAAAAKVYTELQTDWKKKTMVSAPGDVSRFQVRVAFDTLQQWAETQKMLKQVDGVNDVVVKSLSPRGAEIDLLFQGGENRLRLALQQADMTLSVAPESGAGGYYERFRPRVYELRRESGSQYRNRF